MVADRQTKILGQYFNADTINNSFTADKANLYSLFCSNTIENAKK
jgi:hypothetical protein